MVDLGFLLYATPFFPLIFYSFSDNRLEVNFESVEANKIARRLRQHVDGGTRFARSGVFSGGARRCDRSRRPSRESRGRPRVNHVTVTPAAPVVRRPVRSRRRHGNGMTVSTNAAGCLLVERRRRLCTDSRQIYHVLVGVVSGGVSNKTIHTHTHSRLAKSRCQRTIRKHNCVQISSVKATVSWRLAR